MRDQRDRKNQNTSGDMNRSSGSNLSNNREGNNQTQNEDSVLQKGIARVGNTGSEGDAAEKIIDRDNQNS